MGRSLPNFVWLWQPQADLAPGHRAVIRALLFSAGTGYVGQGVKVHSDEEPDGTYVVSFEPYGYIHKGEQPELLPPAQLLVSGETVEWLTRTKPERLPGLAAYVDLVVTRTACILYEYLFQHNPRFTIPAAGIAVGRWENLSRYVWAVPDPPPYAPPDGHATFEHHGADVSLVTGALRYETKW